jgi:tRNA A58 N-methylase Trm61
MIKVGADLRELDISEHNFRDAIIEYEIHQIDHSYKDSTDYDVIVVDRPYSPVAIMDIASSLTQGTKKYPKYRGEKGTPCFEKWKELGFKFVPK